MTQIATIGTIAQWAGGTNWRMSLPHSNPSHALIWITKGQARILLDGMRRGLGVHNAVVIPAGSLFSIEPGVQCFGWVAAISPGGPVLMPDNAQILRILEVHAQMELTGILEIMQRETRQQRPFADEAMAAHAALMTVWLRRAMIDQATGPVNGAKITAAQRLVMAYCALIEQDFAKPKVMADYAAELGVTPTHLTRCCRQCADITAADLLTQRILYAARDALEVGTAPFRMIASDLGFGSAAYFSRFILQHTGQSPSALRKSTQPVTPT